MKSTLNADEIRAMLPHRWPFLLLDRVIELIPQKSAVGIKNVTVSEPFFEGHFPQHSILPGVLILESLAQLTAIVYGSGIISEAEATAPDKQVDLHNLDIASRVGYLVSIRNMKFRKPVVPGDQMILRATIVGGFGKLSKVNVSAHVERFCVAEGELGVSQVPEEDQDL